MRRLEVNMESKSSKILAKVISIVMLLFMCGLPIVAATVAMTKGHTETTSEMPVMNITESTMEAMRNPWKVTTQKRIAVTTIVDTNTSTTMTNTSVTTVPVTTEEVTVAPVTDIVKEEESVIAVPDSVQNEEPPAPEPPQEVYEEPVNNVVQEEPTPQPPQSEEPAPVPPDNSSSTDEEWYYPQLYVYGNLADYFSYDNQKTLKGLCDSYGVDYELMLAVIAHESGYQQYAQSSCGAIGYCQVMPITITQFNWDTGIYYDSYYDPYANMHVGVHTMKACLNKFGNIYDACAAYNIGLYGHTAGNYNSYASTIVADRDAILALK